jgi:hypothetical protein
MSPVASPNLPSSSSSSNTGSAGVQRPEPSPVPPQRGGEREGVAATPAVTARVKQMHPADLALLSNAARSIRLRSR